jgi:hypothetical protein
MASSGQAFYHLVNVLTGGITLVGGVDDATGVSALVVKLDAQRVGAQTQPKLIPWILDRSAMAGWDQQ